MHKGNRHRAFADRRGDAFDRAVPNVAGGEHAGHRGLQIIGLTVEFQDSITGLNFLRSGPVTR